MNKIDMALQSLIADLTLNHEYCPKEIILDAAAELRRLHEQNQELLEALKLAQAIIGHPDDQGSKFILAAIAKAEVAK